MYFERNFDLDSQNFIADGSVLIFFLNVSSFEGQFRSVTTTLLFSEEILFWVQFLPRGVTEFTSQLGDD